MKSFKFKKIKSERPRKTFFASKGKSRDDDPDPPKN